MIEVAIAGPGTGPDHLMDAARWAVDLRWDDLPEAVRRSAGLHALDAVGVALRTSRTAFGAGILAGAAGAPPAGATLGTALLGGGMAAERRLAALVNGALIHGLEFDDTHVESVVHGSAVVLPAALSGAAESLSTADLLVAYVAGWEVLVRLGLLAPGAYQRNGFQTAAVCGPIGAAVTAAVLRRATAETARNAMAIATSLASGLMAYAADGANVKRLHLGWAAQGGMAACDMAEWGVRGAGGALEGRQGFLDSFARQEGDFSRFSTLGTRWELEAASFKEYPCCHFIHAYVDCALELRGRLGATPASRVTCPANPAILPVVGLPAADAGDLTRAQYSLALCVAVALHDGAVTVSSLEAATGTPEVVELGSRVDIVPAPTLPFPGRFGGVVAVVDAAGRSYEQRLDCPNAGGLDAPASERMVLAKFMANAAAAQLPGNDAKIVVDCLLQPEASRVGEWLPLVAGRSGER